jgi:hypothetical protein
MFIRLIQKSLLICLVILASIWVTNTTNAMLGELEEEYERTTAKRDALCSRHYSWPSWVDSCRKNKSEICYACKTKTMGECISEYDFLSGERNRLWEKIRVMKKEKEEKEEARKEKKELKRQAQLQKSWDKMKEREKREEAQKRKELKEIQDREEKNKVSELSSRILALQLEEAELRVKLLKEELNKAQEKNGSFNIDFQKDILSDSDYQCYRIAANNGDFYACRVLARHHLKRNENEIAEVYYKNANVLENMQRK